MIESEVFGGIKFREIPMTIAVQNLLNSFNTLSEAEKHEATVEILKQSPESGDLSDSVLCEIADELFQAMDKSEAKDAHP